MFPCMVSKAATVDVVCLGEGTNRDGVVQLVSSFDNLVFHVNFGFHTIKVILWELFLFVKQIAPDLSRHIMTFHEFIDNETTK